MNILFIAGGFDPSSGGVERVTDILAKGFEKAGHSVYYLCSNRDGKYQGAFKDVTHMDKTQTESFDDNSVRFYRQFLAENRIDIIINQYPIAKRNDFFLIHAPENVKKISFYHGSPLTIAKTWLRRGIKQLNPRFIASALKRIYIEKKRYRDILHLSDKFGFLCDDYINAAFPKREQNAIGKCFTMPNPNTFVLSDEEKKAANIRECSKTIIFVGRIYDPGKNLMDFIRVWEILSGRHQDWKAIIVGDDSKCTMQKEYIRSNHIERISFHGITSDMQSTFLKTDIQCITSHSEGWSLVLTEGMSCGVVPVVFDTFATVGEIIVDGQSGYLVEKYNIQAMADKVSELIDSPELLRKMRSSAMERIAEFSAQAIARRWEQIFTK